MSRRLRCCQRRVLPLIVVAFVLGLWVHVEAAEPVKIGLVAALSGISAKSGEGIVRGLTIAMDEINTRGGVLGGRKLELVMRDDESNPPKGQTAARELIHKEKVAVIFGGIDSPVALAIVPVVNKDRVPYIGVWAAATPITRNGANPNFVFRVSAVDVLVDRALLQYAMKVHGTRRPGMMLINNPWGESNQQGLAGAIAEFNLTAAGYEKFETQDVDMVPQLTRLKAAQADAIILVCNAAPGAQVVRGLERMGWDIPVISHWGISGGRFPELAGAWAGKVDFVQTYSFFGVQNEVGRRVLASLKARYQDVKGPGDAIPPVGIANTYDALHLTALAIDKAGSTDGDKVRQAFYQIGPYPGLIKTYDKPFTPDNHDALNEHDYIMVRYQGDQIVPVAR